MWDFITGFWPRHNASLWEYLLVSFIYLLMAILVIMVAVGLLIFVAWICKLIFYDFSYAASKSYKGEVVDMEYTAPRTTVHSTGKSTYTTTTPEKNVVVIKTELKTVRLDSDRLYQRVRVGESVTLVSQSVYIKPKLWQGSWEYDGDRLLTVTSEKNQTVEFNEEKPSNYRRF